MFKPSRYFSFILGNIKEITHIREISHSISNKSTDNLKTNDLLEKPNTRKSIQFKENNEDNNSQNTQKEYTLDQQAMKEQLTGLTNLLKDLIN